jgi:hypothetical protein
LWLGVRPLGEERMSAPAKPRTETGDLGPRRKQ